MAKLTLQEQMLKAGLVNSKKLAKAKKSSKKSRTQAREAKEAVAANKEAQIARDKALNDAQKEQANAKAIQAQIKQMIEMNRLDLADGDIRYNFTDQNLVKWIDVDKKTQDQLIKGRLAIVRVGEAYAVIPASAADKIAQRDASYIVLNNEQVASDTPDEDDPYAEFVIPDDLMW
ncbi:MAG: DUF2058 domain-containing protein [Vibrio sp.]